MGLQPLLHLLLWRLATPAGPPDVFLRPAIRQKLSRPQHQHRRCRDAREGCAKLGSELFAPNGECKYPAAELCRRSCGLCRRARLAATCRTPAGGCAPLCSKKVDWGKYFRDVLERPVAKERGGRLLSKTPWLIEIPNFLTPQEATTLISLGSRKVVPEDSLPKKIRDVGKYDCEDDECLFHPLVGEVYRRASELLGVGMENFESLEFLRYKKGQHYKQHPDASSIDDLLEEARERGAGQRIMTVFFYLTDVEEGGETYFPYAKPTSLKVKPETGKIVVWANVKNDTWTTTNFAIHQAIPMKSGLKWAANFWVHPTDLRAPAAFSEHC